MLHDLDLVEFYRPCLTYALKRIGRADLLKDYDAFMDASLWQPWNNPGYLPRPGDLLRWDYRHTEPGKETYFLRMRGKTPMSRDVFVNCHYGVYEGDGLTSDLIFVDHRATIRFEPLADSRKPDWVFILPARGTPQAIQSPRGD